MILKKNSYFERIIAWEEGEALRNVNPTLREIVERDTIAFIGPLRRWWLEPLVDDKHMIQQANQPVATLLIFTNKVFVGIEVLGSQSVEKKFIQSKCCDVSKQK